MGEQTGAVSGARQGGLLGEEIRGLAEDLGFFPKCH